MSRQTVKSTCNGLRSWYQQMKKAYPTDIDDDGRGLFTQWFEDGGFEENEMQGEFDEKLDCAYLDFANNDDTDVNEFPFPDALSQSEDTEKQLFQLRIMRHCWMYGTAPTPDVDWADEKAKEYNLDSIDYTAMDGSDTAAMEWVRKQFEQSCTKQSCTNEPDVLSLVAIGYQNKLSLATYLVDCFVPIVRARLDKYVADKEKGGPNSDVLTVHQWMRANPYFQKVEKEYGNKVVHRIDSAINSRSFRGRVEPLLDPFRPVIADNLSEVAALFYAAMEFVYELPPNCSMFGFSIAVRECSQQANKVLALPFGGDDNDDDDDDDDEKAGSFFDVLQDVEDRLKRSGTRFEKQTLNPALKINLLRELRASKKMKAAADALPPGGRLCCLVDRRKKMTQFAHYDPAQPGKDQYKEVSRRPKSNEPDEIYFFVPPKDCDTVDTHNGVLREVYFDRMKQCLIPNANYLKDNGKCAQLGQKDLTTKSQQLREAITSESKCNGGLLTFSFQIGAKDEIACYLIWNGRCIRFLPDDIRRLLPLIFTSTDENKKFADSVKDPKRVEYEDQQFSIFYEKVTKG